MTDWMLTWTTVLALSTLIMAVAIGTTAVFAIFQVLDIKKSRYSGLLMQIIEMWNSTEYVNARRMINEHAHGNTSEEKANNFKKSMIELNTKDSVDYYEMVKVANFFENLGFLTCKKDYLNREDAVDLFGGSVKYYWEIFSRIADYDRNERQPKRSDEWIYFEKLAMICKK